MSKAIMLAAGRGSRLRALDPLARLTGEQEAAAGGGQKALVPVAGFPLIAWLLAALERAGISEVCLVVAPDSDALRSCATRYRGGLRLEFVVQAQPRGTADAVLVAESFASDPAFLVVNSDNYYPVAALRALCSRSGWAVMALDSEPFLAVGRSNVTRQKLDRYAYLDCGDSDGRVVRIVEKPPLGTFERGGMAGVNAWRFGRRIFDACRRVEPSARGELELPEAAQLAITEWGIEIEPVVTAEPMLDLSARSDIAEVERLLPEIAGNDGVEPVR